MAAGKKTALTLGERMKNAREKKNWKINDLARESGYPPGILQDLEADKTLPPVSLLLQLSKVLNLNMEDDQPSEGAKASKSRTKSHRKRVASYAYTPLTEAKVENRLRAYMVTIEAETEHKGVEYKHEGEEFIYVLKGGLIIQVGENITVLSRGETIHFNSALHHKLSNPTSEQTKLLVVIYTP